MTANKLARVKKLAESARYPKTFDDTLALLSDDLCSELIARQIAKLIDGPIRQSYNNGHTQGLKDA
jgi:hypothetical protein